MISRLYDLYADPPSIELPLTPPSHQPAPETQQFGNSLSVRYRSGAENKKIQKEAFRVSCGWTALSGIVLVALSLSMIYGLKLPKEVAYMVLIAELCGEGGYWVKKNALLKQKVAQLEESPVDRDLKKDSQTNSVETLEDGSSSSKSTQPIYKRFITQNAIKILCHKNYYTSPRLHGLFLKKLESDVSHGSGIPSDKIAMVEQYNIFKQNLTNYQSLWQQKDVDQKRILDSILNSPLMSVFLNTAQASSLLDQDIQQCQDVLDVSGDSEDFKSEVAHANAQLQSVKDGLKNIADSQPEILPFVTMVHAFYKLKMMALEERALSYPKKV